MISNSIHILCEDISMGCSKSGNNFMDESIPNIYLNWFENVLKNQKSKFGIFEIYSSQVGRIRPIRPPAGFLPFKYDRPNHEVYSVSFSSSYLFYSRNGSMLLWPLEVYTPMRFPWQASELLFKSLFFSIWIMKKINKIIFSTLLLFSLFVDFYFYLIPPILKMDLAGPPCSVFPRK